MIYQYVRISLLLTLILFPDRLSHSRCGRSLSPSMYPILLLGRLRTLNSVSRDTPIILTRRLLATES